MSANSTTKTKQLVSPQIFIISLIIILYIVPIGYFKEIGLQIDQYLFSFILVIMLIIKFLYVGKIRFWDFLFFIVILYYVFLQRSLYPMHLIALIVVDLFVNNAKTVKKVMFKTKVVYVAILFSGIYSIYYFSITGRYLSTSIIDPNLSGFMLFMLFLIIKKIFPKTGDLLLFLGVLTLSRSYLLALIIYYFTLLFLRNKTRFKVSLVNVFSNFLIYILISVLALLLLSSVFQYLHSIGGLSTYSSGFFRIFSFLDYSNYFRFTVNTNLLHIYYKWPQYLYTGIETEQFFRLNQILTLQQDNPYRLIRPHNYIFSYLQIYGIFSFLIFGYLSLLFKRVVNYDNFPVYAVVLAYITFLGIGVTSYWLFLTVMVLILYSEFGTEKKYDRHNNYNKNI